MAELGDATDLGSVATRRGGSSPLVRTKKDIAFRQGEGMSFLYGKAWYNDYKVLGFIQVNLFDFLQIIYTLYEEC